MDILTVIPARGGSKRLPNKNILPFAGGRPLVRRTIDVAMAVHAGPIVVTTDSDEVISACDNLMPGCIEIIRRPPELAQGEDGSMIRTLQHAVHKAEDTSDLHIYPWILLLQPTSPLRTVEDVEAVLDMARSSVSSVVSVKRIAGEEGVGGHSFKTNGAIYLINRHTLLRNQLWGPSAWLYVMPPGRSIDIDTKEDFEEAERLWKSMAGQ